MELIIFGIFSLICILISSMVFYKKGLEKGKNELFFYQKYNYEIQVKSDNASADKKYNYYNWDVNVEQAIGVGDFVTYGKSTLASTLKRDYGTNCFKVIARRIIEGDKSSRAILIVCPASKIELQVMS